MLTQSLRFGGFSLFVQRQLLRTIQHEMIVNYLVSFGVLFLQHTLEVVWLIRRRYFELDSEFGLTCFGICKPKSGARRQCIADKRPCVSVRREFDRVTDYMSFVIIIIGVKELLLIRINDH